MTQPLPKPRFRELAGYGIAAAGGIILLTWFLESQVAHLSVDWSFIIPTLGMIGAAIPTVSKLLSWVNSRLEVNDRRLREIEIAIGANKATNLDNSLQIVELQKTILRQEAKIEAVSSQSRLNEVLDQLISKNEAVLKRLHEENT